MNSIEGLDPDPEPIGEKGKFHAFLSGVFSLKGSMHLQVL
jgi:hypothetical protein